MAKRDLIVDVRVADMPEVKALIGRLRAAFDRYGRHDRTCVVVVHGGDCTCGFEAALANLEGGA